MPWRRFRWKASRILDRKIRVETKDVDAPHEVDAVDRLRVGPIGRPRVARIGKEVADLFDLAAAVHLEDARPVRVPIRSNVATVVESRALLDPMSALASLRGTSVGDVAPGHRVAVDPPERSGL